MFQCVDDDNGNVSNNSDDKDINSDYGGSDNCDGYDNVCADCCGGYSNKSNMIVVVGSSSSNDDVSSNTKWL